MGMLQNVLVSRGGGGLAKDAPYPVPIYNSNRKMDLIVIQENDWD